MVNQEGERYRNHDNQEGEGREAMANQEREGGEAAAKKEKGGRKYAISFAPWKHHGESTWTGGLEEVRTVFPVAEKVRGDVSMYQGLYRNKAKQWCSRDLDVNSIVFDMVLSLEGSNSLLLFP